MGVLARSRSRALAALGPVVAVLVLAGCGGSAQKQQAQELQGASILARTAPLGDRLVKQSEIARTSDEAGQQTFLRLWSLLQYQAWDQAATLFEPGLVEQIGSALLTQSLASDVIVWQSTKPHIVTARAGASGAAVTFLARDETGSVTPASISFEKGKHGEWLVSYFSLLNPALQRVAQARTQAQIEPLATKPSREAARQGTNALFLQGVYRERVEREARRSATKP
ncbi:MAG TPA: hypothetical protein VFW29_12290 [Solirubrobacteraceae bacterium]|nr:hypothetical protein [Solirubrobacteraceae bacterium]